MSVDRAKLHKVYRYLLDWIFPNICPCCEKIIEYDKDFCDECADSLTLYTGKTEIPFVDGFTAYCVYDDNISPAILKFKKTDRGNSYFAFANRIMLAMKQSDFKEIFDYIVPIPMSKTSLENRGYNQSELMAKELRYMINIPYANVLMKTRETAVQKSLDRKGRADNLKGVFAVDPKFGSVSGKNFLLIDDVCTTGSTFTEAAKTLKENGAKNVYAVSFAKTPDKRKDESENDIPDSDDSETGKKRVLRKIMGDL